MGDTIAPAHGVCSHSREVAEVKTGKESLPEQPHDDVFKKVCLLPYERAEVC